MEVVKIAPEKSTSYSVEDMLEEELKDVKSGGRKATKAVVIYLDDRNSMFDVNYGNAGLSCSQIIALLEVMKAKMLTEMGYISDE